MANNAAPTPALTPPPGVEPNFEHPASLVTLSDAIVGICIAVATTFFLARSWVRLFLKRSWICEDWLALVAWGGTVAYCGAIASTMAHYGGEHDWDITSAESKLAAYWINVATIVYGCTIPFTKMTVLWLYRRVFVSRRWSVLDICVVILGIVQGCFYFATTLVKIFQCTPRARIWDKDIPGTCVNTATILNASGVFNVTSDFLILILPIYTIWKLHLKAKKKVLILLVFTFGLCAPAFSVAGLVQRLRTSAAKDFTWDQPGIQFWGAAELTTGLLCFCLPELGILFRNSERRSSASRYRSNQYRKSGSQSQNPSRRGIPQSTSIKRGSQTLHEDPTIKGPYVEIRPGHSSYDIYTSKPHDDPMGHELNTVTVKKEVIIEIEEDLTAGRDQGSPPRWPLPSAGQSGLGN